ncbi:hypothetical protein GCM10017744_082040 [Streptomyces antimycoticus]
MSGTTGATGATGAAGDAEAFAERLRGLKERSGLSYGTLAKRLHMSTSTLHRYCNGTVVPADYASVERVARVCRATPRNWSSCTGGGFWRVRRGRVRGRSRAGRPAVRVWVRTPGPGQGPGSPRVGRRRMTRRPAPGAADYPRRRRALPIPSVAGPTRRAERGRRPGAVGSVNPVERGRCPGAVGSVNPVERMNRMSAAPSHPLPCGPGGAAPRSSHPSPRPRCWEPSRSP